MGGKQEAACEWPLSYVLAMAAFGKLTCLPRRLDAHHKQLISAKTLGLYEDALAAFVNWLTEQKRNPATAGEIDCLLVEYKNMSMLPKHKFIHTIASLEFFIPQLKKSLTWARKVADGYQAAHATQHTVP